MASHRVDYVVPVGRPREEEDGWYYTFRSLRCGPFGSADAAERDRSGRFQRWNRRARDQGGWAWVRSSTSWGVALPDDIPCPLERMVSLPCTSGQA